MMNRYTHGGDPTGTLLDFSANISPLGVPEGVGAALREAASRADRYPDPACRALRAALAEAEGVPEAWILCGGGAADLIYRAAYALRPARAVVTAPAFSEYEGALRAAACREIVFWSLEPDFRLGEGILSAVTPETGMVFLCQPNNPTGRTAPASLLRAVLAQCRERGCVLVMDECFVPFLDEPERHTLKEDLGRYPNLLILRAFTKLYGMAGVRLGYALCADGELLRRCAEAGPPWGVSSLAQAAGIAALGERAYVDAVRTLLSRERPRLLGALRDLGMGVVPGEANFLLFQSPVSLEEPLGRRGILLRGCGNFRGLDESWYRAAVRTSAENDALIAALREVCG